MRSQKDALAHFNVMERRGLSEAQVRSSREKHGRNGRSPEPRTRTQGSGTELES